MPTSGPTTARPTSRSRAPLAASLPALLCLLAASPPPGLAADATPAPACLREDFDSLDGWKPLTFPGIERHSTYTIAPGGGGSSLRAASDASASGILWKETFDVYRCPRIRWRWKADGVYEKGDASVKEGDDYPVRVYVLFPYEKDGAGLGERLRYGVAKALYGEYPPRAALNYIWANRTRTGRILPNAYTDRAMMIVKRGAGDAGKWFVEEADIVADFREAFGEDPPRQAGLAVMNDSDDTGESSVSWVDFIELAGPGP